ncbi:MAG TPA: helix-turn-helix transcriptional regulator [Opitutus sp.]|nr:helix-turn-helix transcriptional regulator [Opitutus sp.]
MTGSPSPRFPLSPPALGPADRPEADAPPGGFDATLANAIDLRLPGLHLRRFVLHRPSAGPGVLAAHPRCWSKAVLFLDDAGGPAAWPEAGALVIVPPGQRRPDRASGRLPLCVEFDFRLTERKARRTTACTVPRAELLRAREQVAGLPRLQAESGPAGGWEGAAVLLNLLLGLLRTAGWLGHAAASPAAPRDSAMHRLLLTMPLESPLEQVVQRSGYQRDHLNRLVKRETGLTLGQFRARRRLSRAKELLAQGIKIGDVAGEVGLPDQSYFARWFRRQTGCSPTDWLQHGVESPALGLALCG